MAHEGIVCAVADAKATAWEIFRALQNNPTCDLVRYTFAGADPAHGQKGTPTDVSVTGVPVRLLGYAKLPKAWRQLVDERGLVINGILGFQFLDQAVNDDDAIRCPATTGPEYDIIAKDETLSTSQNLITVLGQRRA